jgi:hypothetical protein
MSSLKQQTNLIGIIMGTHRHTQTAYVRETQHERVCAMIHTAAAIFTAIKSE